MNLNEKMSTQVSNIDEFGRDLSLRETKNQKAYNEALDYMAEICRKYAGMSWAEISFAEEEEEEEENRKKEAQRLNDLANTRRYLYMIGEYELEEGEILE